MKTICAKDFDIKPEEYITDNLIKLFDHIKTIDENITVIFDKGIYYIDSEKCNKYMLYITNTVGDNEFSKDETPHLNAVPFYFGGLNNVVFDGNDSIFVIDGKVTNIALENCSNVTVKNIEIRHSHPDMHELKVVGKSLFYVDYEIDKDTEYEVINGQLCYFAKDYRVVTDMALKNQGWIGLISKDMPNKIQRVKHPLFSSTKVKDLGNRRIRVYYFNTLRFKTGDCFYVFDVRRQFAGIFINKCDNIVLQNIKQRFNYSLAIVAQDTEKLTVDSIDFSPEKGSARKMASVADFVQICMCRGNIVIKDSYFDGAGDDSLNVHGIHYKITDINNNEITVRFMHPQSHGFNPLRSGDEIAFINTDTLLEKGRAVIEKSELINEYDIKLTLDSTKYAKKGDVIEDLNACPNLEFINNTVTRIITRGLLITTRGKVNIENNHFISTTMSTVLLSDDAKSWYESGMCRDVNIKNNEIDYCGGTPILIKPENLVYKGAIHKNVNIIGNNFKKYSGHCIDAKCTDNIYIMDNKFNSTLHIKSKNCNNIIEA